MEVFKKMKNILKSSATALVGVFTISVLLSGCGTGGKGGTGGTNGQQQGYLGNNINGGLLRDNIGNKMGAGLNNAGNTLTNSGKNMLGGGTTQQGNNSRFAQDMRKAQSIRQSLRGIKGITNVNAIVLGNKCLVGYNTSGGTKDTKALRNLIISKVRGTEKSVKQVTVSSSPNVLIKISTIINKMNSSNNTTSNTVITDFNNLLRSINPAAK